MRVVGGAAKLRSQRIDLRRRQVVLQTLGLLVPLLLVEAGLVSQVALPEPVCADDVQRRIAPLERQRQVAAGRADQAQRLHTAQQGGSAVGRHAQGAGHALQGGLAAVHLALVDVFQRILDAHPVADACALAPTLQQAALGPENQQHGGQQQRADGEGKQWVRH